MASSVIEGKSMQIGDILELALCLFPVTAPPVFPFPSVFFLHKSDHKSKEIDTYCSSMLKMGVTLWQATTSR